MTHIVINAAKSRLHERQYEIEVLPPRDNYTVRRHFLWGKRKKDTDLHVYEFFELGQVYTRTFYRTFTEQQTSLHKEPGRKIVTQLKETATKKDIETIIDNLLIRQKLLENNLQNS